MSSSFFKSNTRFIPHCLPIFFNSLTFFSFTFEISFKNSFSKMDTSSGFLSFDNPDIPMSLHLSFSRSILNSCSSELMFSFNSEILFSMSQSEISDTSINLRL